MLCCCFLLLCFQVKFLLLIISIFMLYFLYIFYRSILFNFVMLLRVRETSINHKRKQDLIGDGGRMFGRMEKLCLKVFVKY